MANGSGKSLGKIVLTHRSVEAFKPATEAYRVADLRCPGLAIALELVAAVLGHEVGDKSVRILTRHYVRTDLLERKKVALQAWDDRLRSVICGRSVPEKVIQLSDVLRA
jgi:hypothetical protein